METSHEITFVEMNLTVHGCEISCYMHVELLKEDSPYCGVMSPKHGIEITAVYMTHVKVNGRVKVSGKFADGDFITFMSNSLKAHPPEDLLDQIEEAIVEGMVEDAEAQHFSQEM